MSLPLKRSKYTVQDSESHSGGFTPSARKFLRFRCTARKHWKNTETFQVRNTSDHDYYVNKACKVLRNTSKCSWPVNNRLMAPPAASHHLNGELQSTLNNSNTQGTSNDNLVSLWLTVHHVSSMYSAHPHQLWLTVHHVFSMYSAHPHQLWLTVHHVPSMYSSHTHKLWLTVHHVSSMYSAHPHQFAVCPEVVQKVPIRHKLQDQGQRFLDGHATDHLHHVHVGSRSHSLHHFDLVQETLLHVRRGISCKNTTS